MSGAPGIAYGNIVGSNIANILLIVGASAILSPFVAASAALKRDGLVMVAEAIAFATLVAIMPMGRIAGLCFIAALAFYVYLAFRQERASPSGRGAVYDKSIALQNADRATVPEAAP